MSKDIPTPYVWTFQPQMGAAAGASQDYGTKMNWLSAGPSMIHRVNNIREARNRILLRQAALTETPRTVMNPPNWPSALLYHDVAPPTSVPLPRNERLEIAMTNHGAQLAGGGHTSLPEGLKRELLFGSGIQLNEQLPVRPYGAAVRADGTFQLAGGSRSSFNPREELFLKLQSAPSQPRSGGIGSWQFVEEFVPAVYYNPFSGPPGTYPDQFISNYDVVSDSVDGYD
ncbi:pVIII [Tree shrew adenovirus 1]|uniref:Pre-hexon-linking protein VIII n=1 Tax=Tree shrew adenovirus serotype 1 TaxID=47680 RepID=A0A2U9AGA3_ADET1|nr:pVIII [Tree shrew adenovirus 1]